jgi:hypothetical protein
MQRDVRSLAAEPIWYGTRLASHPETCVTTGETLNLCFVRLTRANEVGVYSVRL